MARGLGILLVVILFGSIGAGGRYVLELLPTSPIASGGLVANDLVASGPVASGPVAPVPRPAPASVNEAMEGTAPAGQYPLSAWTLDQGRAGEVSQAFIAGPQPAPLGARPLAGDDVLLLAGWAGDPALGLRFDQVIFSLCGQVVGWAAVEQPRPDVVRYINASLTRSGWTARLPVALLPRCRADMLQTWAAGPTGILYPLQGDIPLPALPPNPRNWMPPAKPPLRPQDMTALQPATLVVERQAVALRRCAGETCETLSRLARGSYHAAQLDSAPGWSLVVTKGQAGWLARQDFQWQTDGSLPPGLSKPWPKPDLPGPVEALESRSIKDKPPPASSSD